MSKKHFIRIAAKFNEDLRTARVIQNSQIRISALLSLALGLCDIFADDNDRFDRERFLNACGFTAEERGCY